MECPEKSNVAKNGTKLFDWPDISRSRDIQFLFFLSITDRIAYFLPDNTVSGDGDRSRVDIARGKCQLLRERLTRG